LFVWFHAPHEPVATPEAYTRLYSEIEDPTKRIYYGSVSLVDHEVGRLLQVLDDLKLREKTFLMFTSDNGPETLRRYKGAERSHGSPGPLRGMKLHVHEGGYRVPGIIDWPGKTAPGTVCEEPVCGTDVLPTLCDIAGVKAPDDRPIDGASMMPLFEGKPIVRTTPLYWQYDRAISTPWTVSLRQGPWKLLADAKLERFELHHLVEDVGEARDRAEEEPERVKEMAKIMTRLHRDINIGR
jgi:arylsulfatase A